MIAMAVVGDIPTPATHERFQNPNRLQHRLHY
jgi:hypothetical protein